MKRSVQILTILCFILTIGIGTGFTTEFRGCRLCYEVIDDESINWSDAKESAELKGGHLVTITTADENLWLTNTFGPDVLHFHWIGGYQPSGSVEPDGGWSWVTGEPWNFNNWSLYEPNNAYDGEDAVVFDHGVTVNGKSWNDLISTRFTRGYVVEYCDCILVEVHIKPGSDFNSINPNSEGVIPVAILTTEDFDATTIDPLSVEFGPNETMGAHGKGHIEDVDEDGDLDLILHFKTQETGIQCGDTEAILTGETFSGQIIEGVDSINTVGCE